MNILIVEDDPIFAQGLQLLLENMGHQPRGVAQDANEALRLIRATKPDLLLLDIYIQGDMDGIQLAEKLKQMSISTPVIFLTSLMSQEVFDLAKQTNPSAYLTKPVDINQLQRAIELALQNHKRKAMGANTDSLTNDVAANDSIFIKVGRRVQKVHIPNIEYLNVENKYSYVVSGQKEIKVRMAFKDITKKLPPDQFIKVNKSYVVNIRKIESIDLDKKELKLGLHQIPFSKRYQKELLQALDMQ